MAVVWNLQSQTLGVVCDSTSKTYTELITGFPHLTLFDQCYYNWLSIFQNREHFAAHRFFPKQIFSLQKFQKHFKPQNHSLITLTFINTTSIYLTGIANLAKHSLNRIVTQYVTYIYIHIKEAIAWWNNIQEWHIIIVLIILFSPLWGK